MGFRRKAERVLAAAMSAGGVSEAMTFHPAAGEPYPIRGVWDDDHTEQLTDVDAPVSVTGPMASFQLRDLREPPVAEEDELEFDGDRYVIVDIHPDGQGAIDCILNHVDPEGE